MRRLAAAFLALAALPGAPASADDEPVVAGVRFGADAEKTRVVIDSDRPLRHQVFTLAEHGARVVVDLEPVTFSLDGRPVGGGQMGGGGVGLVSGYRYADNSATTSRIVFDLAEPAVVASQFQLPPKDGAAHRLVIDLTPATLAEFQAQAGYPAESARPAAPSSSDGAGGRSDSRTLVVVLDPGHGGHDRGSQGAAGAYEKTVNLALARAIRDRLEATGRYSVVMTRDDDSFVELEDRVRIAREAGADLFLSIHADSNTRSSTRGASVYTLADYAERRSRTEILEEDPWILNIDLSSHRDDVSEILIELVNRDTRNQSMSFAEILIPHLQLAGPLLRNTHRSAGLYVLLAPDVPAVLLEAGFITNPDDEARLTSRTDRNRLADAIVAGVEDYFAQRERLYAAG